MLNLPKSNFCCFSRGAYRGKGFFKNVRIGMKNLIVFTLVLCLAGVVQGEVYFDGFESYPLSDPWDVSGVADWDFIGCFKRTRPYS